MYPLAFVLPSTGPRRTRPKRRSHATRRKRDLEKVETADTARLIEELANGAGRVEAGGGAERLAVAEADHQLGIANRAVETLGTDLAAAEKRLAGAQARVEAVIAALLLDEAQRQAEAIVQAADALDGNRADLDALSMTITQLQRKAGGQRFPVC
jgi:hypothetical protein